MIKNMTALTALAFLTITAGLASPSAAGENKLVIHFFYGRECPHCKALEPEVRNLVRGDSRLELRTYEVWYNKENRALFMRMAAERGAKAKGVPTVIIGKDVYLGADAGRVKALVQKNLRK